MELIEFTGAKRRNERICGVWESIFFAPEVKNFHDNVTGKADIFSVGAILYLLMIGSAVDKPVCGSVIFDFKELEWKDCCPSILNFVK